MNLGAPLGEEPARWLLVFQRRTKSRLVRILACGEFKHVCAYAYLPGARVWLIFDVNLERASPIVIPDGGEHAWLLPLIEDAEVISMARREAGRQFPIFGWCVPAVAHLLGLRTWALRPDSLYRYCLAHGGTRMEGSHD